MSDQQISLANGLSAADRAFDRIHATFGVDNPLAQRLTEAAKPILAAAVEAGRTSANDDPVVKAMGYYRGVAYLAAHVLDALDELRSRARLLSSGLITTEMLDDMEAEAVALTDVPAVFALHLETLGRVAQDMMPREAEALKRAAENLSPAGGELNLFWAALFQLTMAREPAETKGGSLDAADAL